MANPIGKGIPAIFRMWWQHKGSLAISVALTLFATAVYYTAFLGEKPTPLFDFVKRIEFDSLDTRFRFRGQTPTDPRIIIVDIDQHSQEVLGRWPFPRLYFAKLLDELRQDDARVAAFDITFSQPDATARPLQILRDQLKEEQKKGLPANPQLLAKIAQLEEQFNYDKQFAEAIQKFGRVVLGNYFLYTEADLRGVTDAQLDRYANLIAFFTFPQVRPEASAKGAGDEGGEQGRLKLIEFYETANLVPRGAEANTEVLTGAVAQEQGAGFFNVSIDPDGVVRRLPLALPYGRSADPKDWDIYASIDVQALRIFLGVSIQDTVLNYGAAGVSSVEFGKNLVVHPDHVSRMTVDFHGPARTYPYVSFADAALGKFPRGSFKNKIVLVGASATGIGDLRVTPYGSLDFPGVEIHANMIDNMLNKQFLLRGADQALADLGWIFFFGIPLGMWLAVVQPRWMALGFLLAAPFAAINYWAFRHEWWLNFTVPLLFTLVPNVSLVALYRVLVEEQEKRKVRGAFQQYVSPEVIRRLLSDPERVKPRKTPITILFSDVRGFTTISEALDAQELANLLNSYLTEMTRIIFRNRGTLDKYIGDAVMAIWGAPFDEPEHASRCCKAALEMLSRLAELQQTWRERGLPALEIGIGINTGVASVGNMGSALRYGYTAMGDAVNLASRLEGLNKEYGTRVIISESTYAGVRGDALVTRELDLIRVKGKVQPVTIYEVLSPEMIANGGQDLVELFTRGHAAYRQREWNNARQIFEAVLARWPGDGPAHVFLSRCEQYLAEAPEADWDGVYEMKHK
jgi:adenylate cyclase